jgi:predicted RNA polymerase sigma factor
MKWPQDYWPKTPAPPNPAAWDKSVKSFRDDLDAMKKLVSDSKTDLFAKIAWGEGQTILREALLIADHNSHHLGQLIDVRRLLGVWKP